MSQLKNLFSSTVAAPRARSLDIWTRTLLTLLRRIRRGRLVVVLPDGGYASLVGADEGPSATLHLHSGAAARKVLLGGSVGFGKAYVDGDWSSPDPVMLLQLAVANEKSVAVSNGGPRLLRWLGQLRHRLNANTRGGSRRNIAFHYDLGNEFFAAWLDPSMTYSSGLYAPGDATLEDAQDSKRRLVTELLDVVPDVSVLEIGCGWGHLAKRLSDEGCRVTALTLSQRQLDVAKGWTPSGHPIDFRLEDYRDTNGTFDRVVSIEMLEAIGEKNWSLYFRRVHDLLKPGGIAVIQTITIDDAHFPAYRRDADFIQRYVFPGGMLPCPALLRERIAAAGLVLETETFFGGSYARTLAEWRRRFLDAAPGFVEKGAPRHFIRLWDYYLAYCEAGFRAATLDVGLFRLRKAL